MSITLSKRHLTQIRNALIKTPILEEFLTKKFEVRDLESVPDEHFPDIMEKIFELRTRLRRDRREWLEKGNRDHYNETTGEMSPELERLVTTTGLAYHYQDDLEIY